MFEHEREGHSFTACGKTRCCPCFWVAQRFSAAITAVFSTRLQPLGWQPSPCNDFFRGSSAVLPPTRQ